MDAHGVPFSAKDIIETANLPTTLGMRELADRPPACVTNGV